MPFPSLPPSPVPWSVAVRNAHQKLYHIFETAQVYLDSGNLEPHRLRNYGQSITETAYPLVLLLLDSADTELLPMEWIENVASEFTTLLGNLNEQWLVATEDSHANVNIATPVSEPHTGRRGRPRKNVNPAVLHNAFQGKRRIPKTVLAHMLGIDRATLRRRVNELDINSGFTEISDDNLDKMVRDYWQENPDGGRAYVIGRLRADSLRVTRERVVESMNRVDQLGQGMRQQVGKKKERKKYHVPRPNALWHIDGHHKLISWGIVIHGIADGYSRKVTGLRASTNNRAETVLNVFVKAILEHGLPWRVRGDRGGENRDVSILMILIRGLSRASFMWGPSVFNTRIERLWVEVGRRFVRRWRAFFIRLERCHLLKKGDPHHRWLLHHLFLDMINADCDMFTEEWNNHPITGPGEGQSPNDLVFMGELKDGIYDDDCEGLTEAEIYAFYDFQHTGKPLSTESESGKSDSNSDSDDNEASSDIEGAYYLEEGEDVSDTMVDSETNLLDTKEIDANIRHDAVPVPPSDCPFDDECLSLFEQGLDLLKGSGELPNGYGATEDEMGSDGFDDEENIRIGLQQKHYTMNLPQTIWKPRVDLWVQGLFVMNSILAIYS